MFVDPGIFLRGFQEATEGTAVVKRFVGLRVLYIYSFAFDLVELGVCTRIRVKEPAKEHN